MTCDDSGLNYWAVSDVNEKELQEFKQLFEQQVVPVESDRALARSIGC